MILFNHIESLIISIMDVPGLYRIIKRVMSDKATNRRQKADLTALQNQVVDYGPDF